MIRVVKARLGDSPAIRKLEKKVWGKNVTSSYDTATFVEYGHTLVAKEKGKIIGAIIGLKTMNDEIRVIDWVVDPTHRRRGVGEKLYAALLHQFPNKPIIAYVDEKNAASIHGHKKLGFNVVKKTMDPWGTAKREPTLIFRKE
jgi:ribosomal protein S18 acetylase RimI-like enzyme